MSRMSELSLQIEDLVERGMSAKFIAATLNVPIEWAEYAIEERYELERQNQDSYDYGEY